jgi:hypothetical protein
MVREMQLGTDAAVLGDHDVVLMAILDAQDEGRDTVSGTGSRESIDRFQVPAHAHCTLRFTASLCGIMIMTANPFVQKLRSDIKRGAGFRLPLRVLPIRALNLVDRRAIAHHLNHPDLTNTQIAHSTVSHSVLHSCPLANTRMH